MFLVSGRGSHAIKQLGLRRKQFFFEKKNQKTFVSMAYAAG